MLPLFISNHKQTLSAFSDAAELNFITDCSLSIIVENDNVGYSCINSINLLILDPVSCIANRISFALHLAKSSASDKVAHLNFVIP